MKLPYFLWFAKLVDVRNSTINNYHLGMDFTSHFGMMTGGWFTKLAKNHIHPEIHHFSFRWIYWPPMGPRTETTKVVVRNTFLELEEEILSAGMRRTGRSKTSKKSWSPSSLDGLFHGKSQDNMDDNQGKPYFRKPPSHLKKYRWVDDMSPFGWGCLSGGPWTCLSHGLTVDPNGCTLW